MKNTYKLPLIVAICHIPLLLLKTSVIATPKKKPIVIKTIQLRESKMQSFSSKVRQSSMQSPLKKTSVKKVLKNKTVRKKNIVKKAPKKVVRRKKITPKKKVKKSNTKALIAAKKRNAPKQKTTNKMQSRKKDAGKINNDYNVYISRISEVFTNFLVLPETGSVTLAITIKGDKVSKIVLISSKSSKNLRYLQENLPKLSLPVGLTKDTVTFNLVFSDEK